MPSSRQPGNPLSLSQKPCQCHARVQWCPAGLVSPLLTRLGACRHVLGVHRDAGSQQGEDEDSKRVSLLRGLCAACSRAMHAA